MLLDFYAASQGIAVLVTCLCPEDYLHARCKFPIAPALDTFAIRTCILVSLVFFIAYHNLYMDVIFRKS